MNRIFPFTNELVSFAVMLLMAIALVAGEADATVHEAARAAAAAGRASVPEKTNVPFSTTISTRIAGQPLTISIDAIAEVNHAPHPDQ